MYPPPDVLTKPRTKPRTGRSSPASSLAEAESGYVCTNVPKICYTQSCTKDNYILTLLTRRVWHYAAAEEVVDMRGGSAELTQTYFYSLVR